MKALSRALFPLFAALILSATACVTPPTLPETQIRRGDAPVTPGPVVLFDVECRGVTDPCTPEFKSTIIGRLSSELELAGYKVIIGETLFAEARRRKSAEGTIGGAGAFGEFLIAAEGSTETVLTYKDLPPAGKRALLEEAHAKGAITLNVFIGDDQVDALIHHVHVFELSARYSIGPEGDLGWVVRCAASGENRPTIGGLDVSYTQAADQLAKCISNSAL